MQVFHKCDQRAHSGTVSDKHCDAEELPEQPAQSRAMAPVVVGRKRSEGGCQELVYV